MPIRKLKKIKSFLWLFLNFLSLAFSPLNSYSSNGLVPCGNPGQPPCQLCHFFVLFDNIIDFLLLHIVPPLAALMIAVAGILYFGAIFEFIPGGFETLSNAKKIFSSVIIGLVLIYAAWLIVGLFFMTIGLAEWTEKIYKNWWEKGVFEINCPI